MAKNPITILSNGVALGYAPAGPAHETNEDIAYMRSLIDVEIHSPANIQMVKSLVKESYENQKLRYIRLERKYDLRFDELGSDDISQGINVIKNQGDELCIVSYGYMLGRALDVFNKLISDGHKVTLIDMFKMKPNPITFDTFINFNKIVTIEEQTLSGGFGSIILEGLCDNKLTKKVLRLGLPEKYIFENGDRDYHLNNNGLSVSSIHQSIIEFIDE